MSKKNLLFVLSFSVLLFAAVPALAQRRIPAKVRPSIPPQKIVNKNIFIYRPSITRPFPKPISYTQYVSLSPEVLQAQVQRKIQLKQVLEKTLEKHPCAIGQIVTVPHAKLMYNGVELDVLQKGERILMGGAYKSNLQVALLQDLMPDGTPVLLREAENSFPKSDIDKVIFIIRTPANEKTKAKTRIITYDLATGQIKRSH